MRVRKCLEIPIPRESVYHSKKVVFKKLLKERGPPLHQNALKRALKIGSLQGITKPCP
jgi:hypothetical protein